MDVRNGYWGLIIDGCPFCVSGYFAVNVSFKVKTPHKVEKHVHVE